MSLSPTETDEVICCVNFTEFGVRPKIRKLLLCMNSHVAQQLS